MRPPSKYIVWLALFLGLAVHAVARAFPLTLHKPDAGAETNELTLIRRIKLPSKSPVKGGTPGGASTASNTLDGLEPPPPVIKPDPEVNPPSSSNANPKGNHETNPKGQNQGKTCKRAGQDGCTVESTAGQNIDRGLQSTGLAPPPSYGFTKMRTWGMDRQTRVGLVDWRPESALQHADEGVRGRLDKEFNKRLSKFAEKIYDDLKKHNNDPAWKKRGYNLVAASGRGVRVSTIPRGDAADILYDNYKQRAPGLARVTEETRTSIWPNNMHAEDGVIYQEEATRFREGQGILSGPNDRFPEGSRVALYGSWNLNRVNKEEHVIPCQGKENPERTVSCERALDRLGIRIVDSNYNFLEVAGEA
ncbi:hypothetical protein BDW68DRAFT_181138 [Aspergillus falconensis]